MPKCVLCNQNKAKRLCAGIDGMICSFCCGTKREKEISCFSSCAYLKQGKEYQNSRAVNKLVDANFNKQAEDIFNDDSAAKIAFPLEKFFIKRFYRDPSVNDNDIYAALEKIYSYRTGITKEIKSNNQCHDLIFIEFLKVDRKTKRISDDFKNQVLLRILKSIKNVSGGILGNRNYLEMIYSQFNSNGKWSEMFSEFKENEFEDE